MRSWKLQDAKARFSELVRIVQEDGPQDVTVHGKSAIVILSRKQYDKLTKKKFGFLDFINKSSLKGEDLNAEREQTKTRDIDL